MKYIGIKSYFLNKTCVSFSVAWHHKHKGARSAEEEGEGIEGCHGEGTQAGGEGEEANGKGGKSKRKGAKENVQEEIMT